MIGGEGVIVNAKWSTHVLSPRGPKREETYILTSAFHLGLYLGVEYGHTVMKFSIGNSRPKEQ